MFRRTVWGMSQVAKVEEAKSEVREQARERSRGEQAAQMTGFVGGALALGALGAEGKAIIPESVAGLDTDLIIGGGLFFLSRGPGKKRAMMRGAAYAALAGGLKDLGASLAKGF